ncbi:hypothetical protein IFM89_012769 [Coptis chinensis]|uniref:Cobalamin-independent methionine synthase MetE N-terminal domain-containing protein n=1 Tax=Coptis chinensis TaxID=261450 RepID=A0A835HCA8_9MAGN|nr:hypothetical protein IFM89_012769 [Coptis chinensis]
MVALQISCLPSETDVQSLGLSIFQATPSHTMTRSLIQLQWLELFHLDITGTGGEIGLDTYFSMARGNASVSAMEMTKWFDTNYHFIVPELGPRPNSLTPHKAVDRKYKEASGVPVLVGPVSYLLLSKPAKGVEKSFSLLSLIGKILPIYTRKLWLAEPAVWVLLGFSLMSPPSSRTLNPTNYKHLQAPLRRELESSLPGLNMGGISGQMILSSSLDYSAALEGIVGKVMVGILLPRKVVEVNALAKALGRKDEEVRGCPQVPESDIVQACRSSIHT